MTNRVILKEISQLIFGVQKEADKKGNFTQKSFITFTIVNGCHLNNSLKRKEVKKLLPFLCQLFFI